MLDVIDGVAYLHSLGIVHRDLTRAGTFLRRIPLSSATSDVFVPPVTADHMRSMTAIIPKFSFANDVFALGALLWECCFYNNPHNRDVLLDNLPPPPFRDIFLACTQRKPEGRPTLTQLRAMRPSH